MTTRRNQNMRCSIMFPSYFYCMSIYKSSIAINTFNTIAIKTTFIRIMDTINISLTILFQGIEMKGLSCFIKTVVSCIIINGFCYLSSIPHDFLRDTANINTGSTDLLAFKQDHLSPMYSRAVSRGNPA